MAKNQFIKAEVIEDTINFQFPTIGAAHAVTPFGFSEDIQKRLLFHGLEQKLRDSVAASADTPDAERYERFVATLTALQEGRWNVRVATEKEESWEILADALHEALGGRKPIEAVRTYVQSLDRSGRAKVRAIPEVAAALARRRGKAVSLDELPI